MRTTKIRAIIASLAIGAVALAGCSSGTNDSNKSEASSKSEAPTQSETAAQSDGQSGDATGESTSPEGTATDEPDAAASEAQQIVDGATTRPTKIVVSEPLSKPAPSGKNIYWVECALPACIALGDSLQKAADALNWHLTRIDGGTSPESIKDAWIQVVNATPPADGVLASGFPRSIFEDELSTLEERGVPVVNISTNDEVGGALVASLGTGEGRNVTVGKIQAAATIVSGDGHPTAVYVHSSAFPSNPPQVAAFLAEFSRLCPDCTVSDYDAPIQSIGTTLSADLMGYLQAHPEIDHVTFSYGDMAIGFPAALAELGLKDKIKVIVDTPGVIGSDLMANHDTIVYATAYPGQDFIWQGVDTIIRYMIGDDYKVSAEAPPLQWLETQDNIPSTTEDYPVVADQEAQWKALWHIG